MSLTMFLDQQHLAAHDCLELQYAPKVTKWPQVTESVTQNRHRTVVRRLANDDKF